MKGYYLFAPYEESCLGPDSGVEKKVRAQHRVLNSFCDCELIILPPVRFQNTTGERILRRLPYTASWNRWDYQGEFDDADFLYFRMVHHDQSLIRYFRAIRKSNPKIKILYEVPTYPMGKYRFSFNSVSFDLKEFFARKQLHRYVDRIITFYGQSSIWDVPCIPLMNGFDFSQVSLSPRTLGSVIHIVSVAQTVFGHGYQYMIAGLRDYYANGGTENILYHMVGNVLAQHKKAVKDAHLEEHVVFHGRQSGEALYDIYRSCGLGLNVLGVPTDGNPRSSSLKSREYAALGLPIVSSLPLDFLPEDYPYLCVLPAANEPVDVAQIVRFYHQVYDRTDPNNVAASIRAFSIDRCDMTVTMKPVIDWLCNTEDNE